MSCIPITTSITTSWQWCHRLGRRYLAFGTQVVSQMVDYRDSGIEVGQQPGSNSGIGRRVGRDDMEGNLLEDTKAGRSR